MNTLDIDLDNGITVMVEYSGYYMPAKTYGPPESCYPAEGDCQWEIIQAVFVCCERGISFDLSAQQIELLEIEFETKIEALVWDAILHNPPEPDYYDVG